MYKGHEYAEGKSPMGRNLEQLQKEARVWSESWKDEYDFDRQGKAFKSIAGTGFPNLFWTVARKANANI